MKARGVRFVRGMPASFVSLMSSHVSLARLFNSPTNTAEPSRKASICCMSQSCFGLSCSQKSFAGKSKLQL